MLDLILAMFFLLLCMKILFRSCIIFAAVWGSRLTFGFSQPWLCFHVFPVRNHEMTANQIQGKKSKPLQNPPNHPTPIQPPLLPTRMSRLADFRIAKVGEHVLAIPFLINLSITPKQPALRFLSTCFLRMLPSHAAAAAASPISARPANP